MSAAQEIQTTAVETDSATFKNSETIKHTTLACCHCTKTFSSNRARNKHTRIHAEKRFNCDICCKAFLDKYKLSRHMLVHTGEKPYTCISEGCARSFSLLHNLHAHMRKHTGEKPFQCALPTCARAFARVGNLKAHLKTHAAAILAARAEAEAHNELTLETN
jgi:uncharacterized Zn-finger protein